MTTNLLWRRESEVSFILTKALKQKLPQSDYESLLTQCGGIYHIEGEIDDNFLRISLVYEIEEVKGFKTLYCHKKERWYIQVDKNNFIDFFDEFGSSTFDGTENNYIMDYINPKYTKHIGTKIANGKGLFPFIKEAVVNKIKNCPEKCLRDYGKCYCSWVTLSIPNLPKKVDIKEVCEKFGEVEEIDIEAKPKACIMKTIKKDFLVDGKLVNNLRIDIKKKFDKKLGVNPLRIENGGKSYYVYWSEQDI
jgi:hypothetical protein